TAGKLGISDEPRPAVAGDVELGHHADAAIMRVCNEVANLVLRVKHPVGAHSRKLGKDLALDTETLVVGKMPVQDIHLHCSHAVEVALEHVDWDEVAAGV